MSDPLIPSYIAQRQRAWSAAQQLLDNVAAERRDMSAEENATWTRMNGEIDELDAEIKSRQARATREAEADVLREATMRQFHDARQVGMTANSTEELRRFLRGQSQFGHLEINLSGARRERELLRQGASAEEIRALAWDTGSSASLVPTTLARTMYEYMEASSSMFRAPTSRLVTSAGEPMQLPYLSAHAIGTQVSGQGTAFAGTDPTFARLALDAYKYGQIVKVAAEVIDDAQFDIASFLGRDIGRSLGRLIGTDLAVGSGTGKPRGLMTAAAGNGAGSVTTGGSLIGPTYDSLVSLVYGLTDAYRGPSTAFIMKDSTAGTIRKLRDGAGGTIGAPLWQPSTVLGQPDTLLGYPVFTDTNVSAQGSNNRIMAFADMAAYYIREVGNPVIEIDRSVYFATDEVAVRGKHRVDGDLIDYAAVTTMVQNV